jgi:hypothetical protein
MQAGRLGSSRRIPYAGDKGAIRPQRQGCEPGAHPGFVGSHLMQPVRIRANTAFWLERLKDLPATMDKRTLTERDICTKFILPALKRAGWDEMVQVREEVYFTKGRIIVRGKLVTRGKAKKADFVLYYKPNIPIALIEAKDNNHSVGDGLQQALDYAATLDIPFVFSSNGDGFFSTTARGTVPRPRPISGSTLSRRPPICGRVIASGRASTRKPSRSCFRTISTTAAARPHAIIR